MLELRGVPPPHTQYVCWLLRFGPRNLFALCQHLSLLMPGHDALSQDRWTSSSLARETLPGDRFLKLWHLDVSLFSLLAPVSAACLTLGADQSRSEGLVRGQPLLFASVLCSLKRPLCLINDGGRERKKKKTVQKP